MLIVEPYVAAAYIQGHSLCMSVVYEMNYISLKQASLDVMQSHLQLLCKMHFGHFSNFCSPFVGYGLIDANELCLLAFIHVV